MGKLTDYIEELKRKIESKGNLSQVEILRFIYIDLGRKLDFDLNYTFGNKKTKNLIYNRNIDDDEFNHILETHTSICKGMAYLYERIAKEFGFDIFTEKVDFGKHVYNEVYLDGKIYMLDLEDDLEYIQSGAKTRKFLIDPYTEEPLLSDEELRNIDSKKIDYIPEGYYFEDMVWMLKKAISSKNLSLSEKLDFVVNNLDVYTNTKHVKYRERMRFQERVFEEVFTESENNKIHRVDCAIKNNDNRTTYQSIIVLEVPHSTNVAYIQNLSNNKYDKIEMEDLAQLINSGLEPRQGVPGMRKFRKKVIRKEEKDDKEESK